MSTEKPKCKLVGENGNIFNLLGIATRALKQANQHEQAREMREKVIKAANYYEALGIIQQYVDEEDPEDDSEEFDEVEEYEDDNYDDYDDDYDDED